MESQRTEKWIRARPGFFKTKSIIAYVDGMSRKYNVPPIAVRTTYFSVSINTTEDEQFTDIMDYMVMVLQIPRDSIEVTDVEIPVVKNAKRPAKNSVSYVDKDGNNRSLMEV